MLKASCIGLVIALATVPATGFADTVPVSLRSCTALTEPAVRLACFDKEMAHLTEASAPAVGKHDAIAAVPEAKAPKEPRRVTATVVRVENHPDDLIVHLDNDQVWEQAQETTATMNLRVGDQVTIERSQGSYWLDGPSRVVMKVRQKL